MTSVGVIIVIASVHSDIIMTPVVLQALRFFESTPFGRLLQLGRIQVLFEGLVKNIHAKAGVGVVLWRR